MSEENVFTTDYKGREREKLDRWVASKDFKPEKMKCLTEIKEVFKPGMNLQGPITLI